MFSDPVETGCGGASQGAVGADANILPDVAQDTVTHAPSTLERVGMRAIETAIRYRTEHGDVVRAPALADAFVSLDEADARGIHMSRLYLALDQTLEKEVFSIDTLGRLLENFVRSHSDLSRSASVKIAFDYLRRRRSLLSGREAWRTYPVEFEAESLEGKVTRTLKVRLVYSSACPCSTALSGALMQKRFETEFAGRTNVPVRQAAHWIATVGAVTAIPHSQRSHGEILVRLDDSVSGPFDAVVDRLVDGIEAALGTAVQAAVKRADEQEFARLNGMNAMFCEDAARRMKKVLEEFPGVVDYRAEARHFESLHPHDATAIAVKGAAGGFRP
jgi:GTP cyclohydrolase I